MNARENSDGPLAGLRVIEMRSIGPVPYAAMLLSEYGADVVGVVRPGYREANKRSSSLDRSRPYIELDAKNEADRKNLEDMIGRADVLIEGFRPGVMEKLGLGPDECLRLNPRLIYGRLTGWGQTGPLAKMAGHDVNFLAVSGILSAFGANDRAPSAPLNLVADYAGGSLFLIIGILIALREAERTGRGQVIDAAMIDGVSSLMTATMGMLGRGTWEERREANLLDGGAPFNRTYETADGKYMAVGAIEPEFWKRFIATLGQIGLEKQPAKAEWLASSARIAQLFKTKTQEEWCAIFSEVDCCVTPVVALSEAPTFPHIVAREIYTASAGFPEPKSAPRFSRSQIRRYEEMEGASTAARVLDQWQARA